MNVVDSSAWLEYFSGGPNADFFAGPIEDTAELIVPTLCLYEVFKKVLTQRDEAEALRAIAVMQQEIVAGLNADIALRAAKISHEEQLPMADSIVLATTRAHAATLWTQDADFKGKAGVKFRQPQS